MDDDINFSGEQYENIPAYTQNALLRWVNEGRIGGHFITAVLNNDLKGAFAHADDGNLAELHNIMKWLYNRAPATCYGDKAKVEQWANHKGLSGLNEHILDAHFRNTGG